MLTTVQLDGVMGRKFGREWKLAVSSPAEALRMIEANKPGLRSWITQNKQKYDSYRVICTYEDGRTESLDDDTFPIENKALKSIRFTPVVMGSSFWKKFRKVIVGAVLIVASFFAPAAVAPYLFKIGASLVLTGVIELLSPRPKTRNSDGDEINSYYFDGPENTETQGAAVPLIYGRVLVGSRPISVSISIDEPTPAVINPDTSILEGGNSGYNEPGAGGYSDGGEDGSIGD